MYRSYMLPWYRSTLVALALTSLLTTACIPRIRASYSSKDPLTRLKQVANAIQPGGDLPSTDAPSPKASPVGVVVGYPVVAPSNASGDAAGFANGIGWYMMDAVAGAPEFGQSPLRTTLYQAARERHLKDQLRLSLADAIRLARVTGATHIASGTLTETAGTVTLQYELYRTPKKINDKPVPLGTAITVSGKDRAEVLAKLPDIARQMRQGLGVQNSSVSEPPLKGITPELLARFGQCLEQEALTAEQTRFIADQGLRTPLIAEEALFLSEVRSDTAKAAAYARLVQTSMPANTQAWGSIAYATPTALISQAATLYALSDHFPGNYALAHASSWMARAEGSIGRATSFAARAAKDAPANPDAHLAYAYCLSGTADDIRQGRQTEDIDSVMSSKITPMYEQWSTEARSATQCDPLYGKAWLRLATASTFSGNTLEADAAMTRARALNADDPYETYAWAMEMYAPKWGGDPGRLQEVGAAAAKAHYRTNDQILSILHKLEARGMSSRKQEMQTRLFQECSDKLARDPNDFYTHYLRGRLYEMMGRPRQGTPDFKANVQLKPNEAGAWFDLGRHYSESSQFVEAVDALKKADSLRPNDPDTFSWLGWSLKNQNRFDEARSYLKRCIALRPNDAHAMTMIGTSYLMENRLKEAIPFYEDAAKIQPFDLEMNINLVYCYSKTGQDAKAVALGKPFLRYSPDNFDVMESLGESYVHLKRWYEAVVILQQALRLHPNDPSCEAYLGDAFAGLGDATKAQQAWQQAVTASSPADVVSHARAQLNKSAVH